MGVAGFRRNLMPICPLRCPGEMPGNSSFRAPCQPMHVRGRSALPPLDHGRSHLPRPLDDLISPICPANRRLVSNPGPDNQLSTPRAIGASYPDHQHFASLDRRAQTRLLETIADHFAVQGEKTPTQSSQRLLALLTATASFRRILSPSSLGLPNHLITASAYTSPYSGRIPERHNICGYV